MLRVLICTVHLTVCSSLVTYAFQSKSTFYSLASLAKWLSVHLRTKWLWVWVQLQPLKLLILHLFWARSSLKFKQLESVDSLWSMCMTWQEHAVLYWKIWDKGKSKQLEPFGHCPITKCETIKKKERGLVFQGKKVCRYPNSQTKWQSSYYSCLKPKPVLSNIHLQEIQLSAEKSNQFPSTTCGTKIQSIHGWSWSVRWFSQQHAPSNWWKKVVLDADD